MPKNDYSSWSKEDLIKKVNALEKRKKYGLVWDSTREPEKVVFPADRGPYIALSRPPTGCQGRIRLSQPCSFAPLRRSPARESYRCCI